MLNVFKLFDLLLFSTLPQNINAYGSFLRNIKLLFTQLPVQENYWHKEKDLGALSSVILNSNLHNSSRNYTWYCYIVNMKG